MGNGQSLRMKLRLRYNPVMSRSTSLVRSVRLVRPPTADAAGIICLTDRKGDSLYAFEEIPCAIGGRGFRMHRLESGQHYHVRIDGAPESSCECLGYLAHGRCRHIVALQTLIGAG